MTRITGRGLALAMLVYMPFAKNLAASGAEFIFTEAPFASAHASNIVELRSGDLWASWFGGSAEGKPDVAIWGAKRAAGKWSAPSVLVREPNIACYNPVMFYSKDGRLWLYYKFGPHPTSWTAGRLWSDDDGKTWSASEHLPAGLYGPIRTKPLVLKDGVIVSGSSVESYHSWACWIERSVDNGKTWSRIGPITAPRQTQSREGKYNTDPFAWTETYGIIQPSVVSLGSNRLRLYARSTENIGRICAADSYDGGLTWTQAHPLDLPNPNSGIDAVALEDGRVVMIYNNSTKGRTPLNMALSHDGEHFTMFKTLEDGPGEFSYPAMIQSRNGNLYATYTWDRKRIRFIEVPVEELPQ